MKIVLEKISLEIPDDWTVSAGGKVSYSPKHGIAFHVEATKIKGRLENDVYARAKRLDGSSSDVTIDKKRNIAYAIKQQNPQTSSVILSAVHEGMEYTIGMVSPSKKCSKIWDGIVDSIKFN